jgi:hypothetical protein
MSSRLRGTLLVAIGALLVLPQIVAERPWQAAVLVGLLLAITGGALIVDNDPKEGRARG